MLIARHRFLRSRRTSLGATRRITSFLASVAIPLAASLSLTALTTPPVPAAAASGTTCSTAPLGAGLWHTLTVDYNGNLWGFW